MSEANDELSPMLTFFADWDPNPAHQGAYIAGFSAMCVLRFPSNVGTD